MFPWLLLVVTALFFGGLFLGDVLEIRRATRRLEEETEARGPMEGLDVEPEDVVLALTQLVDIVGVDAVYQEKSSNTMHVLAAAWVTDEQLQAVKDSVRASVPIGLSARVVRTNDEVPDGCVLMARSWAA